MHTHSHWLLLLIIEPGLTISSLHMCQPLCSLQCMDLQVAGVPLLSCLFTATHGVVSCTAAITLGSGKPPKSKMLAQLEEQVDQLLS
jgi:hypothetical protein